MKAVAIVSCGDRGGLPGDDLVEAPDIDPQPIDELRLRSAVDQVLMRFPARTDAYAQR
jgi:hypothetical protein